jgi:hypothetical protein
MLKPKPIKHQDEGIPARSLKIKMGLSVVGFCWALVALKNFSFTEFSFNFFSFSLSSLSLPFFFSSSHYASIRFFSLVGKCEQAHCGFQGYCKF